MDNNSQELNLDGVSETEIKQIKKRLKKIIAGLKIAIPVHLFTGELTKKDGATSDDWNKDNEELLKSIKDVYDMAKTLNDRDYIDEIENLCYKYNIPGVVETKAAQPRINNEDVGAMLDAKLNHPNDVKSDSAANDKRRALVISLQNAGPLFGRFDASKNYGTEKAFKIAEHNHKEYVKALKDTYADAKANNDTFSIDVIKSTCEKYGIVIEENFGVSLPKYSFEKWNFTTQSELIYIADEFLKTIDKSFSVSNGDLWNKAKQNLMRAVLSYMYETDCQQMTAKRASDIFRLKSESLSDGTDNTKFDKLFEDLHKTNENSFAYKEYTSCMLLPKKTIEAIIISICLDLINYIEFKK